MKIEKMNDRQIKFILTQNDLLERDIKISELTYGSDKIQNLFHEMMEEAMSQFGFEFENTPLMIEAAPISLSSIMIIVTKVAINGDNSAVSDLSLNSIGKDLINSLPDNDKIRQKFLNALESFELAVKPKPIQNVGAEGKSIYRFAKLDNIIDASAIIKDCYFGVNTLYKLNNLYYLVADNSDYLETRLTEYGDKVANDVTLFESYLLEHGDVIIKDDVIQKFWDIR